MRVQHLLESDDAVAELAQAMVSIVTDPRVEPLLNHNVISALAPLPWGVYGAPGNEVQSIMTIYLLPPDGQEGELETRRAINAVERHLNRLAHLGTFVVERHPDTVDVILPDRFNGWQERRAIKARVKELMK
jgi:hypothetical protein